MIETNVDRLLKLLQEKKQTTVRDAAGILGAKENQIEKIANYLMEEGIISVDYKLSGIALILTSKEEKKAAKLMPKRFKLIKKIIKKKPEEGKKVPKGIEESMRSLLKQITKKGITENELDEIQDSFQGVLLKAMKQGYYDKTFFSKAGQFYELIESKRIVLLINRYKETKDKKQLVFADELYGEFVHLQEKLSEKGYAVNVSLREQLRKVLDESFKIDRL